MRPPWYNVEWSVLVGSNTSYEINFDRPGYLNYGGMGAIAAHELTVRLYDEFSMHHRLTLRI